MNSGQIWAEIAQAALNFIVVNSLTNSAQGRTVMDMKTDLRTTKEDILAELKETRDALERIELSEGEHTRDALK